MRSVLFSLVILAACGKKNNDGLPPANEWGANMPGGSAQAQPGTNEPPLPDKGMPSMDGVKAQGGDTLPPGHPPVGGDGTGMGDPGSGDHVPVASATAEKSLEKLAPGHLALGKFDLTVPEGWSEVPTKSDMRVAQFKVGADAELVVTFFGPDGAGSTKDNVDRWAGQFAGDGKPSNAKIDTLKVADKDATVVAVSGHMKAAAMPGAAPAIDKADQGMVAAIVPSPDGPFYMKLVGPQPTIAANEAKFRAMLTGLKVRP